MNLPRGGALSRPVGNAAHENTLEIEPRDRSRFIISSLLRDGAGGGVDVKEKKKKGQTLRYGRLLNLFGGPALIGAGFVFLPPSGPSYIIIVMGLWMLAGELLTLARLFERVGRGGTVCKGL